MILLIGYPAVVVVRSHLTIIGFGYDVGDATLIAGASTVGIAALIVLNLMRVRSEPMKKHRHPREDRKSHKSIKEKRADKPTHSYVGSGGKAPLVGPTGTGIQDNNEPFAGWLGYIPESAIGNPEKTRLWKEYVKKEQELWKAEMKNEERGRLFGRSWARSARGSR